MRTASNIAGMKANRASAVSGTKNAETGIVHRAIVSVINQLAPRKAWAFVAEQLGLEERTAKHRIASTRQFSADEVGELLRSEDGFRYLAAIMSAAPNMPLWFRICAPLMELADVQRMQLAARRRYEAAIRKTADADEQLTATLRRGQAALMVQDEGFYSARLAPMGELASELETKSSTRNRSLAAKTGGMK